MSLEKKGKRKRTNETEKQTNPKCHFSLLIAFILLSYINECLESGCRDGQKASGNEWQVESRWGEGGWSCGLGHL